MVIDATTTNWGNPTEPWIGFHIQASQYGGDAVTSINAQPQVCREVRFTRMDNPDGQVPTMEVTWTNQEGRRLRLKFEEDTSPE